MTDNEKKMIWRPGFPVKRGVYFCRVDDGPQVALHHHHCELNKKHWWTYTNGKDVPPGSRVEFRYPAIVSQK